MEHKITTERILEAAKKCGTAKDVLRVLFPDAFEEELKFCVYLLGGKDPSGFMVRKDGEEDMVIDGSKMPKELIVKNDYILNTEFDGYNNLHISFKDKE